MPWMSRHMVVLANLGVSRASKSKLHVATALRKPHQQRNCEDHQPVFKKNQHQIDYHRVAAFGLFRFTCQRWG